MFKSINHLGNDKISYTVDTITSSFKIIDDDFEIITSATGSPMAYIGGGPLGTLNAKALIFVYEERKLNVVANLIRMFLYEQNKYNDKNWASIEKNIVKNTKFNEIFLKYKDEVEKYLLIV